MTDRRKQISAVFFAAVMVISMVAAGAVVGPAAAEEDLNPDEITKVEANDVTPGDTTQDVSYEFDLGGDVSDDSSTIILEYNDDRVNLENIDGETIVPNVEVRDIETASDGDNAVIAIDVPNLNFVHDDGLDLALDGIDFTAFEEAEDVTVDVGLDSRNIGDGVEENLENGASEADIVSASDDGNEDTFAVDIFETEIDGLDAQNTPPEADAESELNDIDVVSLATENADPEESNFVVIDYEDEKDIDLDAEDFDVTTDELEFDEDNIEVDNGNNNILLSLDEPFEDQIEVDNPLDPDTTDEDVFDITVTADFTGESGEEIDVEVGLSEDDSGDLSGGIDIAHTSTSDTFKVEPRDTEIVDLDAANIDADAEEHSFDFSVDEIGTVGGDQTDVILVDYQSDLGDIEVPDLDTDDVTVEVDIDGNIETVGLEDVEVDDGENNLALELEENTLLEDVLENTNTNDGDVVTVTIGDADNADADNIDFTGLTEDTTEVDLAVSLGDSEDEFDLGEADLSEEAAAFTTEDTTFNVNNRDTELDDLDVGEPIDADAEDHSFEFDITELATPEGLAADSFIVTYDDTDVDVSGVDSTGDVTVELGDEGVDVQSVDTDGEDILVELDEELDEEASVDVTIDDLDFSGLEEDTQDVEVGVGLFDDAEEEPSAGDGFEAADGDARQDSDKLTVNNRDTELDDLDVGEPIDADAEEHSFEFDITELATPEGLAADSFIVTYDDTDVDVSGVDSTGDVTVELGDEGVDVQSVDTDGEDILVELDEELDEEASVDVTIDDLDFSGLGADTQEVTVGVGLFDDAEEEPSAGDGFEEAEDDRQDSDDLTVNNRDTLIDDVEPDERAERDTTHEIDFDVTELRTDEGAGPVEQIEVDYEDDVDLNDVSSDASDIDVDGIEVDEVDTSGDDSTIVLEFNTALEDEINEDDLDKTVTLTLDGDGDDGVDFTGVLNGDTSDNVRVTLTAQADDGADVDSAQGEFALSAVVDPEPEDITATDVSETDATDQSQEVTFEFAEVFEDEIRSDTGQESTIEIITVAPEGLADTDVSVEDVTLSLDGEEVNGAIESVSEESISDDTTLVIELDTGEFEDSDITSDPDATVSIDIADGLQFEDAGVDKKVTVGFAEDCGAACTDPFSETEEEDVFAIAGDVDTVNEITLNIPGSGADEFLGVVTDENNDGDITVDASGIEDEFGTKLVNEEVEIEIAGDDVGTATVEDGEFTDVDIDPEDISDGVDTSEAADVTIDGESDGTDVELVHQAIAVEGSVDTFSTPLALDESTILTSFDDAGALSQYNATTNEYERGVLDLSRTEQVNQGFFVQVESSEDERVGFDFATGDRDKQETFTLEEGTHLLGTAPNNINEVTEYNVEIQEDAQVEVPDDNGAAIPTEGVVDPDTNVKNTDAYWVFLDEDGDRLVFSPGFEDGSDLKDEA
ncbi:midas domain-containing protein [Halorubrum vacuolatum]|uniref:Surface glycoprotein n=1 Tax=Halorubrum vacuolatum TaxID=63740 RepID=A0A238Y4Q8_HALVU|nr:hypothetical protein [Halorubrum vacuolatum]SNR65554.1 hypothetical protein SAMN06264855_1299 [Halorubrum vacuolatum]